MDVHLKSLELDLCADTTYPAYLILFASDNNLINSIELMVWYIVRLISFSFRPNVTHLSPGYYVTL